MHELSITQNILSIALEHAGAAQAKKITRINIVIGELSGIVDECVEFYFEFLSKDTMAAGAALYFERPETSLRCRDCHTIFSPVNPEWNCPGCGKQNVEIVSGRECRLSSIEVD